MRRIVIEYDPATVVDDSEDYDLEQHLREFFESAEITATITEEPDAIAQAAAEVERLRASGWTRADFAAALKRELESAPEPRFLWADEEADASFATLSEMIHDNRGDNEPFCDWLRSAEVGQHYSQGGGAAPRITTWRIS